MPSALSPRTRTFRALFVSIVAALALAGTSLIPRADASPRYLVCELQDKSLLYIVIANFGGVSGAVHHCVHFWNGRPRGVEG